MAIDKQSPNPDLIKRAELAIKNARDSIARNEDDMLRMATQKGAQLTDLLKEAIDKRFSLLEMRLREQRLLVGREFKRLKDQLPSHDPKLMELKSLSRQLQDLSTHVGDLRALASTSVVTTKPIMNKARMDAFINTMRKSWTLASKEMEKYAKEHKVSLIEVKKQVIAEASKVTDQNLARKFETIFGRKPRDMSKQSENTHHPRRHRR